MMVPHLNLRTIKSEQRWNQHARHALSELNRRTQIDRRGDLWLRELRQLSSSCQPAQWQVNKEMTSQLAGGPIQRGSRLRRCWDLPWSLWPLCVTAGHCSPSWSPFSVFVKPPLITPVRLLHSVSADSTRRMSVWVEIRKFNTEFNLVFCYIFQVQEISRCQQYVSSLYKSRALTKICNLFIFLAVLWLSISIRNWVVLGPWHSFTVVFEFILPGFYMMVSNLEELRKSWQEKQTDSNTNSEPCCS